MKCEWTKCERPAVFSIRKTNGVPAMSKRGWFPRWCHRHVLATLKLHARHYRYRKRKKAARELMLAGRPNRQADLRERVTCVECGKRPQVTKAWCSVSRHTVLSCPKSFRTHGLEPCPAYCRACCPWKDPQAFEKWGLEE